MKTGTAGRSVAERENLIPVTVSGNGSTPPNSLHLFDAAGRQGQMHPRLKFFPSSRPHPHPFVDRWPVRGPDPDP